VLTVAGLGSDLVVVLVLAAGVVIALDRWGVASTMAALVARVPSFMARGNSGWGVSRQAIRLDGLALALIAAAIAVLPLRIGALTLILFVAFMAVAAWTMFRNYWGNRPSEGRFRLFRGKVRGWELLMWLLVWLIGAVLYVLQNLAYHYPG
jgi:hypothetical protein